MKKIFVGAILFFVVLIFVSCGSHEKKSEEINSESESLIYDEKVNGAKFSFREISKEDFDKIPYQYVKEQFDKSFVLEKTKSGFVLPLSNGQKKEFINKAGDEDGQGAEKFSFVGKYSSLPFYVMFAEYYEYSLTLLVDENNGEINSAYDTHVPFTLPNKKGFLFQSYGSFFEEIEITLISINDKNRLKFEWKFLLGESATKEEIKVANDKFFVKYDESAFFLNVEKMKPIFLEISWLNGKYSSNVPLRILSSTYLNEKIFKGCIAFEGEKNIRLKIDNACTSSETDKIIKEYKMENLPEETKILKKRINMIAEIYSKYDAEKIKDLKIWVDTREENQEKKLRVEY
ncbi:MAG: hypothetical protein ACRCSK_04835 [Fusobacteriaceae bacterium]